jgi:hypothetical protein
MMKPCNPNETERTNYTTFSKYTDPWILYQFFLCNPTSSKLLQPESQCVKLSFESRTTPRSQMESTMSNLKPDNSYWKCIVTQDVLKLMLLHFPKLSCISLSMHHWEKNINFSLHICKVTVAGHRKKIWSNYPQSWRYCNSPCNCLCK